MCNVRAVALGWLTVLFACISTAQAQAGQGISTVPPDSMPAATVHATTNLVLVDVVVSDHGKPVRGLDRNRFHVFEDGKERPLSSFDEHQPSPAPPDAAAVKAEIAAMPPHTYTNVPVYPDAGVVNVLLLDALNTPMANQADARRQMIAYLNTIPPGTSLAIFTLTSQLRLVEGFTTDAARLTRVLKSKAATSSPSVVLDTPGHSAQQTIEDELSNMADPSHMPSAETVSALQQFETDLTASQLDVRVRTTLGAMQQLARYLSAIQGRKNLIWFSGSFPITFDPDPDQPLPFLAVRNYSDEIRRTSDLLTSSRVAVYPIDARGLLTSTTADAAYSPNETMMTEDSGGKLTIHSINDSHVVHDYDTFMTQTMEEHGSMQQIAQQTGGAAYVNDNDLKGAVASAVANGASYYTLAFAPGKKLDGHFRRIQVKLDGGYALAYRRGYYADRDNKPSSHSPGMTSALDAAALHGAPSATQVIFVAKVLPSTAPELQGIAMSSAPAGEMAAQLTGATARYLVDLRIDAHTLTFTDESDGVHQAQVEFVIMAYDGDGKRLNYVDRSYAINVKPEEFTDRMTNGVRSRLAIDVPAGHDFLRVAVEDLTAGHAGSLEVPIDVAVQ